MVDQLVGKEKRNGAFTERKCHDYVRKNNIDFPLRVLGTNELLCIQNLSPEFWTAANPDGDSFRWSFWQCRWFSYKSIYLKEAKKIPSFFSEGDGP